MARWKDGKICFTCESDLDLGEASNPTGWTEVVSFSASCTLGLLCEGRPAGSAGSAGLLDPGFSLDSSRQSPFFFFPGFAQSLP